VEYTVFRCVTREESVATLTLRAVQKIGRSKFLGHYGG
jgi:hypothetical protein